MKNYSSALTRQPTNDNAVGFMRRYSVSVLYLS